MLIFRGVDVEKTYLGQIVISPQKKNKHNKTKLSLKSVFKKMEMFPAKKYLTFASCCQSLFFFFSSHFFSYMIYTQQIHINFSIFGFSFWDVLLLAYHKSHRIPDSQQVISTDGVEHLLGCRVEAVDAEGRSLLLAKENRHVTVQGRWMETWVKHGAAQMGGFRT